MRNTEIRQQILAFNPRAEEIHASNVMAGWWTDLRTGQTLKGKDEYGRDRRNVGELLMLVVSELAEAAEGYDGELMDDKLPHRVMIEVELADAAIRIFDIAGGHELDLTKASLQLLGTNAVPAFPMSGRCLWSTEGALMLIVQQVARAMEGHRKNAPDAVLTDRKAFEVGLAAALLLIYELGFLLALDVDGAITEKRAFNAVRSDHKVENRTKAGGKTY